METRLIGSLSVSVVGLGCNDFGTFVDEQDSRTVVEAALDEGISFFDTADIYGRGRSEGFLGRALGRCRDDVVIATKVGLGDGTTLPKGSSVSSIQAGVEGSLRRLGTDRLDLFQLHAPGLNVPVEETLDALSLLRDEGKIVEIGCSNFDGRLLDQARAVSDERQLSWFVSAQNELSLLRRRNEADLLSACDRHSLVLLPYFPLASGLLTGKYRRGEGAPKGSRLAAVPAERRESALSDRHFDVVEALDSFARDRGHTLLELAMSWLAGLTPIASVIAGATKPEQVRANVAAVGWSLTSQERAEIDGISPQTVLVWGQAETV